MNGVILSLLVCLSTPHDCRWQRGPETYATPVGCLVAAQAVAASYEASNPGRVRAYRCGREERGA